MKADTRYNETLILCSMYLHFMFCISTFYVLCIYILCSMYLHFMFHVSTFYIPCIYILYSMYLHFMFHVSAFHVPCIHILCSMYLHFMFHVSTFYVPCIYIFLDFMQVFIIPSITSKKILNFVWIYIDASCWIPWLYVHTSINLLLVVILSTFNQKSGVIRWSSVIISYLLDSHVAHCVKGEAVPLQAQRVPGS
jgi:hypothetical protein